MEFLRLRLEVFHDVEEFVVDIRIITELYFDLIKIAECIIQDRLLTLQLSITLHW